jgi:prolyl-tRNA editing enzyme YbaK/EbsC (Cys-tRNA(Pro) deacylase)
VTPLSAKVRSLRVILDPAVLDREFVVCGGGSLNILYKVEVRDLVKYLNPLLVDVFR